MRVKGMFKGGPEEWFDIDLTDDHRMLDVATGKEITRTDIIFKSDGGELIDMEEEWDEYRSEMVRMVLHESASYLAWQVDRYAKGHAPQISQNLVFQDFLSYHRNRLAAE